MSGKLMTFNIAVSTNCLIQTNGSVELSDTMTVLIKVIKQNWSYFSWFTYIDYERTHCRQCGYTTDSDATSPAVLIHVYSFVLTLNFVYKCCETTNRYSSDLIYTFRFIP